MYTVFYQAYAFNQNINSWDTSKVLNMQYMFYQGYAYNQDMNSWDTPNVNTVK